MANTKGALGKLGIWSMAARFADPGLAAEELASRCRPCLPASDHRHPDGFFRGAGSLARTGRSHAMMAAVGARLPSATCIHQRGH